MADGQTEQLESTAAVVDTTTVAVRSPDQNENPPATELEDAPENPTVLQTVSKMAFSLATTAVVYALGYWRIASVSTWVLLPVMACLSIARDRWREAGRIKRRRAQLIAIADEKTLITANVSELPSWVFFPDIHRAEWLNQVFWQYLTYDTFNHHYFIIQNF